VIQSKRATRLVAVAAGLAMAALGVSTLSAQFGGGQFGGGGAPTNQPLPGMGGGFGSVEVEPAPRVYIEQRITPRAAKVWETLAKPISMPFGEETTLDDAIRYVQQATASPDDTGIPIYVDPVGLLEAEKTLQSPVTINLEGMPLSTSLELMLKQLGLASYVRPEGLLVITHEDDEAVAGEPTTRLLNQVAALREEVAALRREIQAKGK